jgi:hypothetical protein
LCLRLLVDPRRRGLALALVRDAIIEGIVVLDMIDMIDMIKMIKMIDRSWLWLALARAPRTSDGLLAAVFPLDLARDRAIVPVILGAAAASVKWSGGLLGSASRRVAVELAPARALGLARVLARLTSAAR